jgi:hypothetical protein
VGENIKYMWRKIAQSIIIRKSLAIDITRNMRYNNKKNNLERIP